MARPRMVTRTFITTTAEVTVVRTTENGEKGISVYPITLPGRIEGEQKIEKAFKKAVCIGDRFVSVDNIQYNENLYGMTEEAFLAAAHPVERSAKNNKGEQD